MIMLPALYNRIEVYLLYKTLVFQNLNKILVYISFFNVLTKDGEKQKEKRIVSFFITWDITDRARIDYNNLKSMEP